MSALWFLTWFVKNEKKLPDSFGMESLPNGIEKTISKGKNLNKFFQTLKCCDWKQCNYIKNCCLCFHKPVNSYFEKSALWFLKWFTKKQIMSCKIHVEWSLPNWVEKTVIRKKINKAFVQSLKFCDWKLFNCNKNVQLHYHRGKHFNSYF